MIYQKVKESVREQLGEPPATFIEWFVGQINGQTDEIARGLAMLVHQGALVRSSAGWRLTGEYASIPLKELLEENAFVFHSAAPAPLTRLVGRVAERSALRELIDSHRLVTILGLGGVGKTRLAIQVANEHLLDFRNGVAFVSLVAVETPELAILAIAERLGFSFHGSADPKEQLIDYLREKAMLLVLDNCEHFVEGLPFLEDLLAGAPGLHILATSRVRLGVYGENGFRLTGLQVHESEGEGESDAVEMFVQAARRAASDFVLDDTNRASVQEICVMLDGLPLGIELSAAWTSVISCREIADRLGRDQDFLVRRNGSSARHHSLRTVFLQSWMMLTEEEQQHLQRLAVFKGSFDSEAALAVGGVSLQMLGEFLDKSLVQREVAGRVRLHPMLYVFLLEKLSEQPEAERRVRARHGRYYAEFLERSEADIHGEHFRQTRAAIEAEMDNVREAWYWAVTEGDIDMMGRCLPCLAYYCFYSDLNQEGERLVSLAVDRLRDGIDEGNASIFALLLFWQARFSAKLSQYDKALEIAGEAVSVASASGAACEHGFALTVIGNVKMRLGQIDEAKVALDQAFELAKEGECIECEAIALNWLAVTHYYLSDYEQAHECMRRSVELFHREGHLLLVSKVLNNQATIALMDGKRDMALALWEQALDMCKYFGVNHDINTRINMAQFKLKEGEYEQSIKEFQSAIPVFLSMGDRWGLGVIYQNVVYAYLGLGAYATALAEGQVALRYCRAIGVRVLEVEVLVGMAFAQIRINEIQSAEGLVEIAEEISQSLGSVDLETLILGIRGYIALERKEWSKAASAFRRALGTRRELRQGHLLLEPLAGLARSVLGMGDTAEALVLVEEIMELMRTSILFEAWEPMSIPLVCYQTLVACGDERAMAVLKRAYDTLQEKANLIQDDALRDTYLNAVPANRIINETMTEVQSKDSLPRVSGSAATLTRCERQVLRLVVNAHTNSEIANMLVVALPTVKRHLSNIYNKVGAENRVDLVNRARLMRLV